VLNVVDQLPTDTGKVYFGALVELYRGDGETVRYRLVGPDEIDPAKQYISIDSVLGRALLGKNLDDEVTIETPAGERRYEITAIDYPQGSAD